MSRVTAATSLDNMIKMLDADRFDLMVTDLFSGLAAVRKLKLQSQDPAAVAAAAAHHIYHHLHERHRDLCQKVGRCRAGNGRERRTGPVARDARQTGAERAVMAFALGLRDRAPPGSGCNQKPQRLTRRRPRRSSTMRSPPLMAELP